MAKQPSESTEQDTNCQDECWDGVAAVVLIGMFVLGMAYWLYGM